MSPSTMNLRWWVPGGRGTTADQAESGLGDGGGEFSGVGRNLGFHMVGGVIVEEKEKEGRRGWSERDIEM